MYRMLGKRPDIAYAVSITSRYLDILMDQITYKNNQRRWFEQF